MWNHDFVEFGWVEGGDGASASARPIRDQDQTEDDYDQLMAAWLVERGRVVEAELLLARSREILAGLMTTAQGRSLSAACRRKTRRLIREIDAELRPSLDDSF